MNSFRIACLLAVASVLGTSLVVAQSADEVLAANGSAKLTRGDYEAELLRIPSENREAFASDPRRLTTFLNNILISKTLAVEARRDKIDADPATQRLINLEIDRVLAALEIERIERDAGRDFDARDDQFTAKARELYLVDRTRYQRPEQVVLSQIAVRSVSPGNDAGLALAKIARTKLAAGADLPSIGKEVNGDAANRVETERLNWVDATHLDPLVAKVAFQLKKGEISEPIQGKAAWYVVRVEDKRPPQQQSFDEVKATLLSDLRKRHIDETRDARIAAIRNDPAMIVNQAAIDSLVKHVDPGLMKRLQPQSDPGTPPAR